jgi:anhydro-N-acetylmuramic acid kinase
VHADLLAAMQTEPFFQINGPKSTGRDLFNAAWLHRHLERFGAIAAQDVQATLAELSAWSVAEALEGDPAHAVIVCGGGVRNGYLMGRLSALMPQRVLTASDAWGLPAQQVEAGAFAWLAYRHDKGLVGSHPYVTGAREARILGARYPAGAPGSTLG